MAYTVVSLFSVGTNTDKLIEHLTENGISSENIHVSKTSIEGERTEEMEEDEQTKNFWDYLFGQTQWRSVYQQAGIDNNSLTVYTDNLEEARRVMTLMDNMGAVDIQKYRKNCEDRTSNSAQDLSEREEARIIAKAKHNVFFLHGNRTYTPNSRGKAHRMDSLGSKD